MLRGSSQVVIVHLCEQDKAFLTTARELSHKLLRSLRIGVCVLLVWIEIGEILPADGGDCEKVLAGFAKAGIDVDALAARLQDEGAKSFVSSWNELMDVIGAKSAALKSAKAS